MELGIFIVVAAKIQVAQEGRSKARTTGANQEGQLANSKMVAWSHCRIVPRYRWSNKSGQRENEKWFIATICFEVMLPPSRPRANSWKRRLPTGGGCLMQR